MYHLYHTPAFVLGSEPFGEGSKRFTLFTRELGLISGNATSVREERSKLRYALQDFSYSDITLVRGKDSWRLTSAVLIENIYNVFRNTPEVAALFGRVFRLLQRLLAGEEKNEKLFDAVMEGFNFLRIRITNPYEYTNTEHGTSFQHPTPGLLFVYSYPFVIRIV